MKFQLEQSALEAIRSLQRPGKPDILARLVNIYLDKTPVLIADIEAGVSANDAERVKLAAHTLKSSSAYLGATSLADQCNKLEEKAANDDLSTAGNHLKNISDGFAAVSDQIQKYG